MSNNRLNGQSTPYTFIRRNMYLTKKVKEDDGIFCSCSSTPETSAVCGEDCLCGLLMSSCSSGCKCGSSCLNKPFHQRQVKKMKLVKTEKCGSGIVADEDIKRGEFVIEYVGEVIDDKICEERLWKMKHSGETNFYLCEINRDMVIDATYKGNKSRYINHSCCPNTEMQKWMIDGETRIGTFSTRDIKRGEHLTYDYQFVQFGADQDCHCGSVGCRRKLGVKSNKPKLSASDAALKIVACHLAATSPKLKAPLSTNRIEKMENLLKQSGEQVFDQEFYKKLAQVFSFSKGRAGKPIVKWTEVQTWFQNRLKSCLSKDNLAEANRKLPDVTEECALDKANQRFHMPEGKKVPDLSDLEFEARSSEDGAWYDVDTFISHRFSSGELEVLVRYVGFGPEEDEWINVGKSVRERSVALENSECSKVRVGDTVLCFQERKDHARYVEARILEIQKKFYDLRGCRCLFVIQYDHDNTKETVHLRRLCFRPSILGRLSQI